MQQKQLHAIAVSISCVDGLLVTVGFHWFVQGGGYGSLEKSIPWAAICFYFVVHGGQHFAVDRLMKREI